MATLANGTRCAAHARQTGQRYSDTTGRATARHIAVTSAPPVPGVGLITQDMQGGMRG